jgi:hypothetical protein
MSQEARMRSVIDDAVARATASLEERLEAMDARLRAVEDSGGTTDAAKEERPSRGRTAKSRTAPGSKAGEETPGA